jgi:hypothetical protein
MNESKTEYEPVELGGIKTGDCIEGEIVCDADPGRGSVLINGKILTGCQGQVESVAVVAV